MKIYALNKLNLKLRTANLPKRLTIWRNMVVEKCWKSPESLDLMRRIKILLKKL